MTAFTFLIYALLAAFLTGTTASAQTATGVIQGLVTDGTGAVVTGAKITLTDQATSKSRTQISGPEGSYEFRALPHGAYSLAAEHPGFKKEVMNDISLQVAQTQRLDLALTVGAVTESVEVASSAGLLQVSEPTLSQVIDEKRVVDLPLNGRNFMALTHLSAGVITSGRAGATQRQANYGAGFSVGGQRDTSNVVLLDGLEISGQEIMNYPLAVPSLESVAEFRVQTSNYTAEFGGNSGAVVNVASRRGSNRLHGDLFEFVRNDTFDARNFFSPTAVPLKRNQFGFTVSGPVWLPKLYHGKNKTFFLYNHEWTRQRNAISSTALVPTPAERAGDFSFVTQAGFAVVDPFTKTPFPNNAIPASRINKVGQALANLYPAPNSSDPARNYIGNPSRHLDNEIPTGRIDHLLGSRDSLFGRVTLNSPADRSPGQALTQSFPGYDAIQDDRNIQSSFGWTRIFTTSVVNEALIGYVRFRRDRATQDSGRRNWAKELGIQGFAPEPIAWGAPSVTPTGYPEVGYSSNQAVLQWITQSEQVSDNLSIVHHKHTLKTGFSLQSKRLTQYQLQNANGAYGFSGMFTAPVPYTTTTRYNAVADMLLGYPTSFAATTVARTPHLLQKLIGIYFQDDWRVNPDLTLNLGIRWEYFGRPIDRYDRIASFDLATGQQLFPGKDGVPRSLANQDYNNFAPRVGFAWKVRGSNRLSLRGGYGIYYSPSFGLSWRTHAFQEPFGLSYNRTVRPADPRNPLPVFTADNPLADLAQQVFLDRFGVERNFRDGYVGQWNLTAQYLIAANLVAEVAYRGSKSTRLPTRLNYNETNPFPQQPPAFQQIFPYPALGGVSILEARGAANHNSLQARLERRFAQGFTMLAAYTWQKSLADIDAVDGGFANGAGPFGPQTIKDLRSNKGPSVFDRPHRLALSSLYELPIFKRGGGLAQRLAGGWQVGAIALFESGAYLTPGIFGVSFTGSRANLLGNPNLPHGERTIDRWFDVSKLANPLPGQLGNAGKGTIQGSGHNKWDMIVQKNFKIVENQKVEFRLELFNAFNHPQFDDPQLFPATNPLAGKITSASDFGFTQTERVIQFGLKYHF